MNISWKDHYTMNAKTKELERENREFDLIKKKVRNFMGDEIEKSAN